MKRRAVESSTPRQGSDIVPYGEERNAAAPDDGEAESHLLHEWEVIAQTNYRMRCRAQTRKQ